MDTVTITKKEYKALVFAKTKRKPREASGFLNAGFGVLKKTFGKASSVVIVNKLRKSWRE